jgi:hypothetical protein
MGAYTHTHTHTQFPFIRWFKWHAQIYCSESYWHDISWVKSWLVGLRFQCYTKWRGIIFSVGIIFKDIFIPGFWKYYFLLALVTFTRRRQTYEISSLIAYSIQSQQLLFLVGNTFHTSSDNAFVLQALQWRWFHPIEQWLRKWHVERRD